MNAKTLKALKGSIAKWERNAEAETPDQYLVGGDTCPLCQLFTDPFCSGCPVAKATHGIACSNSPYYAAHDAWREWGRAPFSEDRRDSAHEAANVEVAFLKSLLPASLQQSGGE